MSDRHFKPGAYSVLWFCYFGALGLYNPFAPLWLQSLGLSTLAIGGFASLQAWTRVLAPYGWGWLADHAVPRVRLLRAAAVSSALCCLALPWAGQGGALWVAVAVGALFMANGGISPLAESVVIKHMHDGDGLDARRYARVRVWGSVGFLLAVALNGYVLEWLGIRSLPWLTLGAYGALAWVCWRLADEPATVAPTPAQRQPVLPVLRRPAVALFFAGTMLTVLAHTGQYAFFSLYLKELGYSKGAIGLMWALSVVAEIVFFLMAGRWFARVADVKWLQWAALASVLRFACTAGAGAWMWLLVAMQLLHAVTFGAHHMACTSVIGRHFPEALRGRATALYSTLGYGVPGVLGGFAGGVLSEVFGLAAVFWGSALAALLGWVCYRAAARAEFAPG